MPGYRALLMAELTTTSHQINLPNFIVGTWLIFELIFVVITALPTFVMGMSAALYPPGPRLNALTILAGNLAILLIEPLREAMATLLYFEQRRRRREKDA